MSVKQWMLCVAFSALSAAVIVLLDPLDPAREAGAPASPLMIPAP